VPVAPEVPEVLGVPEVLVAPPPPQPTSTKLDINANVETIAISFFVIDTIASLFFLSMYPRSFHQTKARRFYALKCIGIDYRNFTDIFRKNSVFATSKAKLRAALKELILPAAPREHLIGVW
jgi:hypothetical protein